MKTKGLQIIIGMGILAVVLSFSFNPSKKERLYQSRSSLMSEGTQTIADAMDWINKRKMNLHTGTIDLKDVLKAQQEVAILQNHANRSLDLNWEEVGPDNIGGRTRAILIDKDNPTKVFAGGVSGGIWISTTSGQSWVKYNDLMDNLAISSMCQAANGDIYVGTGEGAFLNGNAGLNTCTNAAKGAGIWKSTDHGSTFTKLTSTWNDSDNSKQIFANVNRLAADPNNANRIYAATQQGLRVSNDGGQSWLSAISDNEGMSKDVKVAKDGTVITTAGSDAYISSKGDAGSFQKISGTNTGNLTAAASRLEFAIAPSDPNYMFCQAATNGGGSSGGTEIYFSSDKGQNWTKILNALNGSKCNPLGDQGNYDNTIAVFPNNKNKIIIGGQLALWIATNNNGQWGFEQISFSDLSSLSDFYVHADQHTIVFHPQNPNILYIGSDGGIGRSIDGGKTFHTLNKKYNVTQFYSVAFSNDSKIVVGGTQDNGSLLIGSGFGNSPMNGIMILGGDGGYCASSMLSPDMYFVTLPQTKLYRYNFSAVDNPQDKQYIASKRGAFITPYVLWESFYDTLSTDSVIYIEKVKKQNPNDTIWAQSKTFKRPIFHILKDTLELGDTIKVKDTYQYLAILGGKYNVFVSRDVLKYDVFNWNSVVDNKDSLKLQDVEHITVSADGNHIYFCEYNKTLVPPRAMLYRASNLLKYRKWSYRDYDTISKTVTDSSVIVKIDSILTDSTLIDIKIKINGFEFDTTIIIDSSVVPPDTIIDIDTTYLIDTIYIYDYTYNIDTTFGKKTIIDAIISNVVNVNTIDSVYVEIIEEWPYRIVTGITVDPKNPENVAVTLGNYGNTNYIYYCSNAVSTKKKTGNFISKQGNLPAMPIFCAMIEKKDANTVLIGTEYGVFSTENFLSSSPDWASENAYGMANVPVYQIRQQILPNGFYPETHAWSGITNEGTIFIATHGRGIFKCDKFKEPLNSVNPTPFNKNELGTIALYPNPAHDNTTIQYDLIRKSNVEFKIYDISGSLIRSFTLPNQTGGKHEYSIDTKDIKSGIYIVYMISDDRKASAKFIKY